MALESITQATGEIILEIGTPLLVALFFLEGLIIGKLLQPPVVFVGVVGITGPSISYFLGLMIACSIAATAGQAIIYRTVSPPKGEQKMPRVRVPYLNQFVQRVIRRVGRRWLRAVDAFFDRYGTTGVIIGTLVPGIRAVIAIPAGISSFPFRRFVAACLLGNILLFPILGGIAYGTIQAVDVTPLT